MAIKIRLLLADERVMRFMRFFRGVICFGASAGITLALYQWGETRAENGASAHGLFLARQVIAQVEGLAFSARAREEEDALGNALRAINQGVEPRLIQVSRMEGLSPSKEVARYDRASQSYEFS